VQPTLVGRTSHWSERSTCVTAAAQSCSSRAAFRSSLSSGVRRCCAFPMNEASTPHGLHVRTDGSMPRDAISRTAITLYVVEGHVRDRQFIHYAAVGNRRKRERVFIQFACPRQLNAAARPYNCKRGQQSRERRPMPSAEARGL
jgi:hypothetical protein